MKKTIVVALIFVGIYFMPWGKLIKVDNVTVSGEAKTTVKNQMASYSAGVNASNNKKEVAVNEVNTKTTELINMVKNFGIEEKDIKTQNVSVYEDKNSKTGTWNVNNSIEITLRNVDRAAELTDLLNKSSANNLNGPSFQVEDTSGTDKVLYEKAMKNAVDKAEWIARASGHRLGKVMVVVDGGSINSVFPMLAKADAMGGAPIEVGSATVSKSLTVTFEMK